MKKTAILLILSVFFGASLTAGENDNIALQDSSSYTLVVTDITQEVSFVDIKVVDKQNVPVQAMIGFRDAKNTPLISYYTDKYGISNTMVYNFKRIRYLSIDTVGYDRVLIPVSAVKNKSARIVVMLAGHDTIN